MMLNKLYTNFTALISITLTCLFLCFSFNCSASVKTDIEKIINKVDPNINIGVYIKEVGKKNPIYTRNANRYFYPASTTKILTTISALDKLGSRHKMKTTLFMHKTNLGTDLYLKFTGSPTLKISDIEKLFFKLKQDYPNLKVNDVYIDDTQFNADEYPPMTMQEDQNTCYAAPINPIIINKNGIKFVLDATLGVGKSARIKTNHKVYSELLSSDVIIKKSCDNARHFKRSNTQDGYHLHGCISSNSNKVGLCLAVKDLEFYAASVLEHILKDLNIKFSGTVVLGETPKAAKAVSAHHSPTVVEMLSEGMKRSDNVIMNSIFLYNHASNKHVLWKEVGDIQVKHLEKILKLNLGKLTLTDGAGMGRNFITPKTLGLIQEKALNLPIKKSFLSTYAQARKEGSVRYRMANLNPKTKVLAKTGSMTGVTNIAGFLEKDGKTYSIVVFVNNYVGSRKPYNRLIDEIFVYCSKKL